MWAVKNKPAKPPSCRDSLLQSSVIFNLTSIIVSESEAAPLLPVPLSQAINTDFSVQGKSSVSHNVADPFHYGAVMERGSALRAASRGVRMVSKK